MAASPRFHTKRQKRRRNRLAELEESAVILGYEFMGWQRDLFAVASEVRVRGPYYYPTVVCTVPRQAGKSVAAKVLCFDRCRSAPDQTVLYMAQTRGHAAKHVESLAKDLKRAGVKDFKYTRGVGQEQIRFDNGSTIYVESPNASGGHGASTSLVVIDEAFTVEPYTMQGITPTLLADPTSQLYIISTQGTEDSLVFNAFVDKGREAVRDRRSSTAYIEFAADLEAGDDPLNPDHWERWMPALGVTVSMESMKSAVDVTMTAEGPSGVRRAYGNVQTVTDEDLIPAEWWDETSAPYVEPAGQLVIAFDCNADPAAGSIAVSFPTEDGWHVDIAAYQAGQDFEWIVKEIDGMVRSGKLLAVASAGGGPARAIMPRIEALCKDRLVPFRNLTVQDMGAAAGLLYDGIRNRSVSHGESLSLDEAVSHARTKEASDLWRFDRKAMRVDASPLVASSVALFAAQEAKATERKPALFFA